MTVEKSLFPVFATRLLLVSVSFCKAGFLWRKGLDTFRIVSALVFVLFLFNFCPIPRRHVSHGIRILIAVYHIRESPRRRHWIWHLVSELSWMHWVHVWISWSIWWVVRILSVHVSVGFHHSTHCFRHHSLIGHVSRTVRRSLGVGALNSHVFHIYFVHGFTGFGRIKGVLWSIHSHWRVLRVGHHHVGHFLSGWDVAFEVFILWHPEWLHAHQGLVGVNVLGLVLSSVFLWVFVQY